MFWQDKEPDDRYVAPDDVIDVAYRIDCKCLPLDHAYALSTALQAALPWLPEEDKAGIHLIHGAESGNGWMRPEDPSNELLHLSRRTRMTLRLPKERLDDAGKLVGQALEIDGYPLKVGEYTVKKLSTLDTIFARYIVANEEESEEDFLARTVDGLRQMGIPVRKILCGRSHVIHLPDKNLYTRSVMLAELPPPESVRLQEQGLGPHRMLGCGLFIPHKGIAPVSSPE